jgi:hypothetical protein
MRFQMLPRLASSIRNPVVQHLNRATKPRKLLEIGKQNAQTIMASVVKVYDERTGGMRRHGRCHLKHH